MILAARTGAFRWLRLALAVLALVASHAGAARAALGITCARSGEPSLSAVAAGAAAITASRAAQHDVALEAPHDASSHAPAQPSVVPQCATSVTAPPAIIDVPSAVTAWDAAALPVAPQMRPLSLAPSPPFRPPRAI